MTYNPAQVRAWDLTSDNDGTVLNSEFARVYQNISEMMLGIAKSVDHTILAADKAGLVRVTNANTKETTKAFSAATPSVVSDLAHGLVTGDSIMVSGSTVETEIGNVHYIVTRINDDTFSLDGTVNAAGGGGNLDWRKDQEITLPAAATNLDNFYTIEKVDANEGAVKVTDGATDYFLYGQYDSVLLKSDGTNWIRVDMVQRGGIANAEQVKEYILTTPIDIVARFAGIGAGFANFMIPELPQDTVAVMVSYSMTTAGASTTTTGVDFSTTTTEQIINLVAEHDPIGNTITLQGTATLLTEQSGGAGNIIRAKIVGAAVTVLKLTGYKVRI